MCACHKTENVCFPPCHSPKFCYHALCCSENSSRPRYFSEPLPDVWGKVLPNACVSEGVLLVVKRALTPFQWPWLHFFVIIIFIFFKLFYTISLKPSTFFHFFKCVYTKIYTFTICMSCVLPCTFDIRHLLLLLWHFCFRAPVHLVYNAWQQTMNAQAVLKFNLLPLITHEHNIA